MLDKAVGSKCKFNDIALILDSKRQDKCVEAGIALISLVLMLEKCK